MRYIELLQGTEEFLYGSQMIDNRVDVNDLILELKK